MGVQTIDRMLIQYNRCHGNRKRTWLTSALRTNSISCIRSPVNSKSYTMVFSSARHINYIILWNCSHVKNYIMLWNCSHVFLILLNFSLSKFSVSKLSYVNRKHISHHIIILSLKFYDGGIVTGNIIVKL